MAAIPPKDISMITINGEEYMPRPHEVDPTISEDMVWTQFPPSSCFISDPGYYDAMGQDLIVQRRIWAIPTESGQVDQFRQLLHERPGRALNMMFAAAAKGKLPVVRFLLDQGVKATANEAEGDDPSLVPLHAAAYQGRLECVKILMEEGKLRPDVLDDLRGTPLMRACWGKHPEIVEYLLDAGADLSVRQIPPSEHDPGTNAFEFAAGSGCVQCARLLINHAEQLGIDTPKLVTSMSVAAAAQSDDLDMLAFVLELGGYPRQDCHGNREGAISLLTDDMKEAIERAFQQTLRQGRCKALKTLFAYIDSRRDNGEYYWTYLKDETVNLLVEAFWQFARHDDEEHGRPSCLSSMSSWPRTHVSTLRRLRRGKTAFSMTHSSWLLNMAA